MTLLQAVWTHTKTYFLSQTHVWWELIPTQNTKSVNLLIIKIASCHSFCTCFPSQQPLIFQRQHCWSGVWEVTSICNSWYSWEVTITVGRSSAKQWSDLLYLNFLHGPAKILRNFQAKRLVTWHICSDGMLHLREIPRFSKKKKKRKTKHHLTSWHLSPNFNSHGYESKFDNTFQVWDKFLHKVYEGKAGCPTHVVLASELPLRDITATTQTYCDHPGVWLDLWEKRKERAEKTPATTPEGNRRSSLISSLGRSEDSVEIK